MPRFGLVVAAAVTLVALVGCAGKTTGASNLTNYSATLTATGRCDSGETCKWYWEYWKATQPRSTSVKTPVSGPVQGSTPDVNLSTTITGLAGDTPYRWVICGSPNNGGGYGCVGPSGTVGSTTADPPPDYGTFTTLARATLAERWNGSTWAIQATPNPSAVKFANLYDVSCTSATACLAVGSLTDRGNAYATLAERWNGTSWTIQATPATSGDSIFQGISCTSSTACTAVGYNGSSPLVERWNGTSWTIQTTPSVQGVLNGVSCTSATSCIAVGSSGATPQTSTPLAERWDGTTWTIQAMPTAPGARSELRAVSCTLATACTAVGFYLSDGEKGLAERWDGTAWTVQSTPAPAAGDRFLHDVSCVSATACTAVGADNNLTTGANTTLAERWNGTTWTVQTTPNPAGGGLPSLDGVSCTSATACTAVGSGYNSGTGVFTPLAEGWDGSSWTLQTAPTPANGLGLFSDVACTSSTACTAVGNN